MAEFKLGRIRFVWKGDWTALTVFYKDDIVRNGGNTYVCIQGHTSPALFTDDQDLYWNKISDGLEWKGDWELSTYYKVNDIVKYGGYLYVCNTAHTSVNNIADGLEQDAGSDSTLSKWDIFTEGFEYKELWASGERYKVNDLVKYNGTIYLCVEPHVSGSFSQGLEVDLELDANGETIEGTKWHIFSEGFYWRNDWDVEIRYRRNDVVRYGGTLYVCNTGHLSAATEAEGLETDLVTDAEGTLLAGSKWDYLHRGVEFRGNWDSTTVKYRRNDVVKYGGGIWICVTPHNPQSTFTADESKWNQFVEGLEFEDSWRATASYQPGDFVTYGGYSYVAQTNNNASKPTENPSDWSLFTTGFNYRGDYDDDADSSGTDYRVGDVVRLGGYTYLCIEDHLYDDELALDPTYTGYRPSSFTNTEYWIRLNSGIEWKNDWTDGNEYDEGDAISYGVNSYICIKPHTADETVDQNRPDQDVLGEFWNVLSGGPESGNLITDGDLVYYGGAGPTRLPIGQAGQVLKVNAAGDAPEWTYFGSINNVFYVSVQEGLDLPAPSYGVTLDRPFKTIRYAAEQIEAGAINYNAKNLITKNRSFIQEEVVEYIDATYTDTATATAASGNVITISDTSWLTVGTKVVFTGTVFGNIVVDTVYFVESIVDGTTFTVSETLGGSAFTLTTASGSMTVSLSYAKETCRRDVGQVLDAAVYDLSHGGNEKSRLAALAYFNEAGDTYVADNPTQTAAGLNFIKEVVDAVLSNLTWGTDVGTLRGALTQEVDTDFIEEANAQTVFDGNIDIITGAITAGNTDAVPAEYQPNNSIFVKTGRFQEILPIVVPKNTAVVGDELRSTRITPAGQLVDSADTPYTIEALERLRDITNTLITDPGSVVKTGSNTEDPVTTKPVGSATSGAFAENLWQQIIDYIDYGVNGATGDSTLPVTYGQNEPQTATGYTYAVETLEANRTFLVEEAIAYIGATYPSYDYDANACRRDVNRYIDAIKHDLIYTGNYRSHLYARYYVNAVNGSLLEDMFYLRNGTGLRNCTCADLTGELSTANEYGTSRPTAGAYASLDPGWGPAHEDAWITNKSPYVQNVTTFGTGCVGLKVDGDLHDGGNDSIVANDFTQVLSDGIGAWVTNLGRSELVSVFSYYNHIGYLSENGGKIRATNGNNSYGNYGSVAEGVDNTETPVLGTVNNQSFDATIQRVLTDGNEILTFEYLNAGQSYTDSTTAITGLINQGPVDATRTAGSYYGVTGTSSGSGTGQEFNVDILDNGSFDIIQVKGGTGHAPGDIITIDVANIGGTGSNLEAEVETVGDATVWTVTGEGFGADISGTVVYDGAVTEVRLLETDVDLDDEPDFGGDGYLNAENVAQGGTNTSITISNTDVRLNTQYIGMAVYLTAGKGAGQYGIIDSYNSGTKIANVVKASDGSAGWDHVIGSAIEATLDDTTNYSIEPALTFAAPPSGLYADTTKARAVVEDERIVAITIWDPGSGYSSAPTMTVTDPNNTIEVPHTVRIADGVLGQPTWTSRGEGMATAQAEVAGDGFMDRYQTGQYIQVEGLTDIPVAGSNVEFAGLEGDYYKLVSVTQLLGTSPYTARLQVSPTMSITDAPEHAEGVEMRIRYSQVRLTGHDFLDIGTGNFVETNYPGVPENLPDPEFETNDYGGGRVFYTSTDQDGNFRVGGLFNVEQSTGIATLNADAFNISGLQELQLGAVELGGTGAVITEFSVDGTFTANSDNIVPTQKAIRTYIQSQIGGGAGELNVNSITAGVVLISTNEITTTTDVPINVLQKVNFEKGVDGHPLAMNYYLNQ